MVLIGHRAQRVQFLPDAELTDVRKRIADGPAGDACAATLERLVEARGWPDRLVIALEQSPSDFAERAAYATQANISLATATRRRSCSRVRDRAGGQAFVRRRQRERFLRTARCPDVQFQAQQTEALGVRSNRSPEVQRSDELPTISETCVNWTGIVACQLHHVPGCRWTASTDPGSNPR